MGVVGRGRDAHLGAPAALSMWISVEGYYLDLAESDPERWMAEASRIRGLIDDLPATPAMKAESYVSAALFYVNEADQRPMAELYRRAVETGALKDAARRVACAAEAHIRAANGESGRVVEILADMIGEYEEQYLLALREEDRRETGKTYAEVCAFLSFSLAHLGRWSEAVEVLERGKCLRQRYTVALRRTPEARALLEIEAELYAISRGLDPAHPPEAVAREQDWFAGSIPTEARLRERYRQMLPKLDRESWRAPTVAEMAADLREGEAALSLGLSRAGLLGVLITAGRDPVQWNLLREDVPQKKVIEWLLAAKDRNPGILTALALGITQFDARPAIEHILAELDDVIGKPVAEALRVRGLTRLVILPHSTLRLTPLWALPSWEEFEVRMAPGAFALASEATMNRDALFVANPTLDLPFASTEIGLAAEHARVAGFRAEILRETEATEDTITAAVRSVGMLHFAGHGIASFSNGLYSALLVSANWEQTPVAGPVELMEINESKPGAWPRVRVETEGDRHRLFYEYAARGTLYGEATNDTVLLAGELWSAGDILVEGTLENCGLAFLCACSSGLGTVEEVEEATGLPAAFQIAGIGCVVGTGWPVVDEFTLLFADEFYTRAFAQAGETVEVARAVHEAAGALRRMPRDEAARRVTALSVKAQDASAKFGLRVFARQLTQGPELPFAHPFDAGAFYVTGAAEVRIRQADHE